MRLLKWIELHIELIPYIKFLEVGKDAGLHILYGAKRIAAYCAVVVSTSDSLEMLCRMETREYKLVHRLSCFRELIWTQCSAVLYKTLDIQNEDLLAVKIIVWFC